jgi:hypothetical protein
MRHDQNSQAVNDFRQGMDMVKSSRITDGANHSENAASSNVQQLAATLNDAESQYHQYTTSSTQSNEFSRMATVAQNQSASLDTNYTQEFVDWAANKYGDKAQSMLTSAPSAREAAMEFVNERLKPEIMGDYQQGRSDLTSGRSMQHSVVSILFSQREAVNRYQVHLVMMLESVTALRMAVLIAREVLAMPRLTERLRALNMEASRVEIILPEQTILFLRGLSQLFIKGKQADREAARVISPRRQGWLKPVDAPLQMKGRPHCRIAS